MLIDPRVSWGNCQPPQGTPIDFGADICKDIAVYTCFNTGNHPLNDVNGCMGNSGQALSGNNGTNNRTLGAANQQEGGLRTFTANKGSWLINRPDGGFLASAYNTSPFKAAYSVMWHGQMKVTLSQYLYILSCGNFLGAGQCYGWRVYLYPRSGTTYLYAARGAATGSGVLQTYEYPNPFTAIDKTTNIVVTWPDNNIQSPPKVYYNGQLQTGTSFATSGAGSLTQGVNAAFSHGCDSTFGTDTLSLAAGVWTRELSEAEALRLYMEPYCVYKPLSSFQVVTNWYETCENIWYTYPDNQALLASNTGCLNVMDTFPTCIDEVLRAYQEICQHVWDNQPSIENDYFDNPDMFETCTVTQTHTITTKEDMWIPKESARTFLDRQVEYVGSVGSETTSIYLDVYDSPNLVFVDSYTRETLKPLYRGGGSVIFQGTHLKVIAGLPYSQEYVMTPWFPKGQSNVATLQGKIQLKNLELYVSNCGGFTCQVTTGDKVLSTRKIEAMKNLSMDLTAIPKLVSKTFKIPISGESTQTYITLKNDSHLPCSFHHASLEGSMNVKSRQIN